MGIDSLIYQLGESVHRDADRYFQQTPAQQTINLEMQLDQLFEEGQYRINGTCKAMFSSTTLDAHCNTILQPISDWFFRYDAHTIDVRRSKEDTFASIACINTNEFTAKEDEISCARHFEIDDCDYLLIMTCNTTSQKVNLWLYNLFSFDIKLLPFVLPLGPSNLLEVSNSSNSAGVSYFAVVKSSVAYIGGISHQLRRGIIRHEYTKLQLAKLDKINNPLITSLNLYTRHDIDFTIIFLATSRGAVEIWESTATQSKLLYKIFSNSNPITKLKFDRSIPSIRPYHVLFLCHSDDSKSSTTIVPFHVSENFASASMFNRFGWPRNYDSESLQIIKIIRAANGHHLLAISENRGPHGLSMSLDISSTADDFQVSKKEVPIPEHILDISPAKLSLNFMAIFGTGMGKILSLYPNLQTPSKSDKLPSFQDWFTRDLKNFPYTYEKAKQIIDTRASNDAELLFDKLLILFEIPSSDYPPIDSAKMEHLFYQIINMEGPGIYYLLKDYGGRVSIFAKQFMIPRPFVLAIDGFWAIDRCNFQEAIIKLTDPSVDLDDPPGIELSWAKIIIKSLLRKEKYQESLYFLNTTRPSLWCESLLEYFLETLLNVDLLEALSFQRQHLHGAKYLATVFDKVFTSPIKPEYLNNLIAANFTPDEEHVLLMYCQNSNCESRYDFLLTYLIQRGRYTEALKAYHLLFVNISNDLSLRGRNRSIMMNNILLLLPTALKRAFVVSKSSQSQLGIYQATLSQSVTVRSKEIDQTNLLTALTQTYINQSICPTSVTSYEADATQDMIVDDTLDQDKPIAFASTPVASMSSSITGKALKTPSFTLSRSPASPFMQLPYTVPLSPQIQVKPKQSLNRKSISRINTPIEKSETQSQILEKAQALSHVSSPYSDIPLLINRSPFATNPHLKTNMPTLGKFQGQVDDYRLQQLKGLEDRQARDQDEIISIHKGQDRIGSPSKRNFTVGEAEKSTEPRQLRSTPARRAKILLEDSQPHPTISKVKKIRNKMVEADIATPRRSTRVTAKIPND